MNTAPTSHCHFVRRLDLRPSSFTLILTSVESKQILCQTHDLPTSLALWKGFWRIRLLFSIKKHDESKGEGNTLICASMAHIMTNMLHRLYFTSCPIWDSKKWPIVPNGTESKKWGSQKLTRVDTKEESLISPGRRQSREVMAAG